MASLDERLKSIESEITELKDLHALLKLDIINIKNIIEQLKFGIVPEFPKQKITEKKLAKPEEVEEKPSLSAIEIMNILGKIGEIQSDIENLKNQVGAIVIPKVPEIKDVSSDIKRINREISRVRTLTERLKARKIRVPQPKISKTLLEKKLKEIMVKDIQKDIKIDILKISKRLDAIEKSLKDSNKKIERLQNQINL